MLAGLRPILLRLSLSPFCTPKDADFRYYEKGLVETTSEAPATTQIYEQTTAPQMVQTTQTSPIVQTTEAPPVAQTTETILVTPECQNNGVPDNVSGTCDCTMTGGYIGDRCERAAKSCVGLYNYNYASGTHPLNVDLFGDGSVFFRTTCHLRNWFSTQISFDIMRSSGSFDASLSYQEYVSGFRFGPDDYWIGLENLHKYTSRGKSYKVRLTVNFNSSNAVGELAIGHNNFIVASSSEGYSYTLDSGLYRGSTLSVKGSPQGYGLDDVLLSQANVPFSAPDEDHDQSDSRHCAQEAQAGWWFGNCSPFVANPFGLSYRTMPGSATDQHFHVSGLDMSQPNVQEAVQFVYVSLDVPKDH
ncbi:hypothetical protein EGW08_009801 [Elysia chlorotica]|uniref:Fibrinogen C-terminal domain-containing protein n=1 Tax=Elysia chlorotica TaxID=188477 RepID=A0A433TLN0_ELYCH|nr:hypothetical protein EGW08_009801 [Elysia chlorotica]